MSLFLCPVLWLEAHLQVLLLAFFLFEIFFWSYVAVRQIKFSLFLLLDIFPTNRTFGIMKLKNYYRYSLFYLLEFESFDRMEIF